VELISASDPLPGVRLGSPGDKDSMELEIALIGPPGAGSVREDVARSYRGSRPPGSLRDRDGAMCPHPRDADNLPAIDKIRVGEAIFGGQTPPINSITRCDLA